MPGNQRLLPETRRRNERPGSRGQEAILPRIATPLLLVLLCWGCGSAPVSHYNLGVEHYTRGRLPEAIVAYKEVMRLNPQDPRPAFNLAVIYQDMGRKDEAAALYQSILRQHPYMRSPW